MWGTESQTAVGKPYPLFTFSVLTFILRRPLTWSTEFVSSVEINPTEGQLLTAFSCHYCTAILLLAPVSSQEISQPPSHWFFYRSLRFWYRTWFLFSSSKIVPKWMIRPHHGEPPTLSHSLLLPGPYPPTPHFRSSFPELIQIVLLAF